MNFKEIYDKASNEYKSEFLYPLLSDNPTLKKQFLEKVEIIDEPTNEFLDFDEFNDEITDSYESYKDELESLELNCFDWDTYIPRHGGYIPEWEATQDMAEDEADLVFSFIEDDIITLILSSNLEQLFIDLISSYFATTDAEVNDPHDNLREDYFIEKHKELIKNAIEKIFHTEINDDIIINAVSLFFRYFESQNEERQKDIKVFEHLLVSVIEKLDNNTLLLPFEKLTSINSDNCPLFSMQIDKKIGNIELWLKKANDTLFLDNEIGLKLLEYYFDENFTEYLKTAKKLFKHNKFFWSKIISPELKLLDDKEFYKEIHIQLITDTNDLKFYLKIKDILSEDEKLEIHKTCKPYVTYRIKMYEADKQFDKVKQLIEENSKSFDFNENITIILNIYPEFCFKLIKTKAEAQIKERGRHSYSKIASWLVLAKKITNFKTQTYELINILYNHKPNLPALKDEFRKNGLI